jgi:hypothetical protein
MARIIRARLDGPNAAPGVIAAVDVVRVISGLQRAMSQAAYAALGQPRRGTTGRHRAAVEAAARLLFVGTEEGSFVQLLALPEAPAATTDLFDLEVAHLSASAFERLIEAVNSDGDIDGPLAASIADLAAELGIGDRHERLTLEEAEQPTVSPRLRAVIDRRASERLRARSAAHPASREDVVTGTLVEADFERGTARLQPPVGASVTVRFSPELADDIQTALRQPSELEGTVSYDPLTAVATAVTVRSVSRGVQLAFGVDVKDFWRTWTLSELQARQGTTGLFDVNELGDPTLDESDRLAFASIRDQ